MALTLSIGITENSYSVANNTSSVTVSVNISWTGGSWDHNYYTKYVTIAGTRYDFNSVKVNPNRTTTGSQTLYSTTVTIGHNSDGTGSVSCYASVKTATGSGTVTASNSKTLTTIPRTSNISISASSVNMGSAITVYTNRKSTSFTHYLYYSIGNGWQRITTGIGDSYSWTVPLSLASSIPSATSRSVSLLLETYSGSTFIGSTSTSFTANVPSSVVPSVSGISVVDNNGYASEFGGYVQSKSVPKITVNASASYSSISQYKVSFQGNSYISSSNVITLGVISQTGSLNITVTATDARGRTASKTVSITGLAYSAPSLSASAIRCDSDGTANDEGAYMKVSCKAEIAPIDNKNSKAVTLKYKKKTVKDWTTQKTWAAYSVNENTVIAADIDSSYDIQLTAEDYFTSANQNSELGTVAVIMDFNASGKGMAIGKVSEIDGLEVDWDLKVNGQIIPREITSNTDLNTIVEPGIYVCYLNDTAETLINCPTNAAFSLEVLRTSAGGGTLNNVVQRLTTYNPQQSYEYRRVVYCGNWSEWQRIITKEELPNMFRIYTASNSKSMTYGTSNKICEITIPAGRYIVFGWADSTVGGNTIMNCSLSFGGSAGRHAMGGTRTTISSGGGCNVCGFLEATTSGLLYLSSYGYMNSTYNIRGHVVAISLP